LRLSTKAAWQGVPVQNFLRVIDASDVSRPVEVGSTAISFPGRVAVHNGLALIAGGNFDLGDVTTERAYLFLGETTGVTCRKTLDVNDDGELNTGDAIFALFFMFRGGDEPAAPYGAVRRGRDGGWTRLRVVPRVRVMRGCVPRPLATAKVVRSGMTNREDQHGFRFSAKAVARYLRRPRLFQRCAVL
jgi:hypothetical protein